MQPMPSHYSLPRNWNLFMVMRERFRWQIAPDLWPVAFAPGSILWGVPLKSD